MARRLPAGTRQSTRGNIQRVVPFWPNTEVSLPSLVRRPCRTSSARVLSQFYIDPLQWRVCQAFCTHVTQSAAARIMRGLVFMRLSLPFSEPASRYGRVHHKANIKEQGPDSAPGPCFCIELLLSVTRGRHLDHGHHLGHRDGDDGGGDYCCWPEAVQSQPLDQPEPVLLQHG